METTTERTASEAQMQIGRPAENELVVRLTGNWDVTNPFPSADEVGSQLDSAPQINRLRFDAEGLIRWDSSLLTFLHKVAGHCDQVQVEMDKQDLPQGVQRLLDLASSIPESEEPSRRDRPPSFLERVGGAMVDLAGSVLETLELLGEAFVAFIRMLQGKARFRRSDLLDALHRCGAQALPIVSLISLLVGLILAFVGAVQLKMFGAQVYVASLVGIGMLRVMGAVMTGVIMAGRTGAAFAAELGTMQVNEEIDALKTLGISPMEFLVLPRVLALTLMMPLLCLYSDIMGILGGFIVGVGMLDLNMMEYYHQTKTSVSLNHLWVGLVHGVVFGVLIALSGCLRGLQCGRNASAVGRAATSAVVTSIVSMIIATAIITVLCDILDV